MIKLEGVGIRRGDLILSDINIHVPQGRYATFVGPSGSGKTTVLEATVGLLPVSDGRILLRGSDVSSLHPANRSVGYVPQDLALFESMSVSKNLGFGLTVQHLSQANKRKRIAETANSLHLSELLDRKVSQLSRGQAQRVAIGRAIAIQPSILMMDEPLNSLDPSTKSIVIECLRSMHRKHRPTVLHVTHQPAELYNLSDARFRLEDGTIRCEKL